ncbi:hypothetical protein ACRQ5Q_33980 [Bradyrhizobium sp. PMVTL-01]|uniref:hypothetical protein n=1 Tax=Bradyrhizobium sp. PMVTL-01 TaxID=3434999 RepID=UPI003F6FF977
MQIERVAEVRGAHGRVADLTEIRTVSGARCKPHRAMMTAAVRVPETVAMEMAAAVMATAVMATAMAATMATAVTAAAFAQSRARQQTGKRHHGNSNDRSQHRILPQSRAIEASEIVGNWNRWDC